MNPKITRQTVGHKLIVDYKGASRNAASVILTVWLVGVASWFVNASTIYNSALAIEPGITRVVSIPIANFMKTASENAGAGSVENLIDRIRNRDRVGISLIGETISAETNSSPTTIEPIVESVTALKERDGDGIILNSVPILDPDAFAAANVGRIIRVLVTGDSLSTFAGQELVKLMTEDPRFVIRVEWANGSGLTKPNVLDWGQYARDLTLRHQPDLVIIILGGSDTVSMVSSGELIDRSSADWSVEYARRIQLVAQEFLANKVTGLVWAGPPPVKDQKRNLSYQKIHESLISLQGQGVQLRYLDNFTNISPLLQAEVDGSRILLRQVDGVHWTRDASQLIARQLSQMLLELRP